MWMVLVGQNVIMLGSVGALNEVEWEKVDSGGNLRAKVAEKGMDLQEGSGGGKRTERRK